MKSEPLFLHYLKIIRKNMTWCRILLIFDEELFPKQFSIKNKSSKVLFLSFILIASITNYMYAKFYEVWTIIFEVIAISRYSGVYFRLKYLHAIVTFYTYLLGISSDEWRSWLEKGTLCSYNMYISVIVISTEEYLCYTHIYRIFCHVTLCKMPFKIALTVYTFALLLEKEDVLYHIHIFFIFLYWKYRSLV